MLRALQTRAQGHPRVRCRAHYTQVQRDYRKNCSCCAQDVISGAWRDRQPHFLWICKNHSGERCSNIHCIAKIGPSITWELLDPISSDEVAKALSTMKDCTPGPDSRKPKDVRALPPNQLVAHYDLWLLPGYLPSALRQGETILLPKEEGAGARRSSVRSRYHRDIRWSGASMGFWHTEWR